MPRFVLLYHDCPPGYVRPSHWDLMFELGDLLETWALVELPGDWQAAHAQTAVCCPACPSLANGNTVAAERLAGHRLAYLDFEGQLSGGRGSVIRVAAGDFISVSHDSERLEVSIDARPLPDLISLFQSRRKSNLWQMTVHRSTKSKLQAN